MLKNFFEEITVKVALHSILTKALLATVLLLNGCTTYVDEVRRDTSYSKKLTQTSVVWTSNSTVQTRITRSGGQGISDKELARRGRAGSATPGFVPARLKKNLHRRGAESAEERGEEDFQFFLCAPRRSPRLCGESLQPPPIMPR